MLAGGVVMAASRRQHCIAMSSTEAELIALGDLALELLYVRGLAESLGLDVTEAIETFTDNKGAYDLCSRSTAGKNSRHVERKVFKMRELRREGKVRLVLVPTAEMSADMLTKPLDDATFRRHRDFVMNAGAMSGITEAHS